MNKKQLLDQLIEFILAIRKREELENFLLGMFTPEELEEVPMRLQIVKLLKTGLPQQEIAKKLGVGIATVTRGSKEIKKGRFKYVK